MQLKLYIRTLVLIFFLTSVKAQSEKSEVIIISTIHSAHQLNPNYSYDSLFGFLEVFNPDVIGIEIRNEDMDSSEAYLKKNYPYEMYACISKYTTKEVVGFDWLGEYLEGRSIPDNYWKEESRIKELQQKLAKDSVMLKKLSVIDIVREEKNKIVLNASLYELNDGRYDLINHIYYEQLETLLKDTPYEALSDFYQKRDEIIAANITEIIRNNTGKKMIFLIGADHRDFTLKKVKETFKDTILLNMTFL